MDKTILLGLGMVGPRVLVFLLALWNANLVSVSWHSCLVTCATTVTAWLRATVSINSGKSILDYRTAFHVTSMLIPCIFSAIPQWCLLWTRPGVSAASHAPPATQNSLSSKWHLDSTLAYGSLLLPPLLWLRRNMNLLHYFVIIFTC